MGKKRRKGAEDAIAYMNSIYGAGCVLAIIWRVPYAGITPDPEHQTGIVVRQFQYGMDARKFQINGNRVRFLKHTRKFHGYE